MPAGATTASGGNMRPLLFAATALLFSASAAAHEIGGKDAAFVAGTTGPDPVPFLYLGAKHMVTGYDHLLFLLGVIFFLFRLREVALYVTLFALGHSLTLLAGVLLKVSVNPSLVDAVIGLSVAYKGFDNLGGPKALLHMQPDLKLVVFGFGLAHGFGLATKLQSLKLNDAGLAVNLISFNVGVELGQLIALSLILAIMVPWRRRRSFGRCAAPLNIALMAAGFILTGYHLAAFFLEGSGA